MKFLLCVCLSFVFVWNVYGNINSGNIVGYDTYAVGKGVTEISLPPKPNRDVIYLKEYLEPGAIRAGDYVKVRDGLHREFYARIIEENGKIHGVVDGVEGFVDDWPLCGEIGSQKLVIKRSSDQKTSGVRSGEYQESAGYKYPVRYVSAPVDELRVSEATAKTMAKRNIPAEKAPRIEFEVAIPKKFSMILKNGIKNLVMVDPKSRMLIDAKTGKPVSVDVSDIAGFSEIAGINTVEKSEYATKEEVKAVARDVSQAAQDYNTWQAIRKGLIGEIWDSEHPWKSCFISFVVLGVIQLISMIWGGIIKFCFKRCKKVFINIKKRLCGEIRNNKRKRSRRRRRRAIRLPG